MWDPLDLILADILVFVMTGDYRGSREKFWASASRKVPTWVARVLWGIVLLLWMIALLVGFFMLVLWIFGKR